MAQNVPDSHATGRNPRWYDAKTSVLTSKQRSEVLVMGESWAACSRATKAIEVRVVAGKEESTPQPVVDRSLAASPGSAMRGRFGSAGIALGRDAVASVRSHAQADPSPRPGTTPSARLSRRDAHGPTPGRANVRPRCVPETSGRANGRARKIIGGGMPGRKGARVADVWTVRALKLASAGTRPRPWLSPRRELEHAVSKCATRY